MSVPDGLDERAAGARLGSHIRMLRKTRGLTLVQLAERTELSHPFLSQLERGLAQPSLGSLRRIAIALETSPIELIAAADAPEESGSFVEVSRPGEGEIPDGFASGTARILAQRARTFHPMEVVADSLEPGERFVHAEDEFLYVIEGQVRIELGDQTCDLEPGASVYYTGGTTHRWWSADGKPYRLLVVKQVPGRSPPRASGEVTA